MKKYKIYRFLLILSCLFLIQSVYAEEGVTVEAEGLSPITNGDLIQAQRLATTDAMRNAVEQVVGTFIDVQTEVNNYQVIRDNILTTSAGFIANYEVIAESNANQVCRITIRAVVKKDTLHQRIDELRRTVLWAGKPRVTLMIDDPSDTCESLLAQGLSAAGFPIVQLEPLLLLNRSTAIRELIDNRAFNLDRIAKEGQADIVVVGQVKLDQLGNFDGLISGRAHIMLKAIKIPTGEIMAVQSFDDTGIDLSLRAAGSKALQKLGPRTVSFLQNELGKQLIANNRTIQLTVTSLCYAELQLLQRHLKASPAVRNVFIRDFKANTAVVDVETGLLAEQMADQMLNWTDLPLEVASLTNSRIELIKTNKNN